MVVQLRKNNHPRTDYNHGLSQLMATAHIEHRIITHQKEVIGIIANNREIGEFFGVGPEGLAIMEGRVL